MSAGRYQGSRSSRPDWTRIPGVEGKKGLGVISTRENPYAGSRKQLFLRKKRTLPNDADDVSGQKKKAGGFAAGKTRRAEKGHPS